MNDTNAGYRVPTRKALLLIRKNPTDNEQYSLEQLTMAAHIDGYTTAMGMFSKSKMKLATLGLADNLEALFKELTSLSKQYNQEYLNMVELLNELDFLTNGDCRE